MSKFSAHYCQGSVPTAFVLSVPGARERHEVKPAAGATGNNLDAALTLLNLVDPKRFPSAGRYDYRITNAFDKPRAKALGHKSSEATAREVRTPKNVARVIKDLSGCSLVLLCGKKAQLLSQQIVESGKRVVKVPHPGNRGLNRAFCLGPRPTGHEPNNQRRVALWVKAVVAAMDHF
jgi:uracil-DNA glycosylase